MFIQKKLFHTCFYPTISRYLRLLEGWATTYRGRLALQTKNCCMPIIVEIATRHGRLALQTKGCCMVLALRFYLFLPLCFCLCLGLGMP